MKEELNHLTAYLDKAGIAYRIDRPVAALDVRHVIWREVEKTIRVADYDIAVAADNQRLAWMETDDYIYFCVKISDGSKELFSWTPESYNLWYGIHLHLIVWIDDTLVLIYREQQRTYICSIRNGQVKFLHFRGHRLAILQDRVYFLDEAESDRVSQVGLPALEKLKDVSPSELDRQGIVLHEVEFTNFFGEGEYP